MRWLPILLAACSSSAVAQNSEQRQPIGSPADVQEQIGPATLDSPLSLLTAIEVNASEDGSNAAIRVGATISRARGRFHVLTLTTGAPFDKDEGSAFTALDPIATGAYLEGRYTFTELLGRRNPGAAGFRFCEEVARQSGVPMGDAGCSDEYVRANAESRFEDFQRLYYPNPTVVFAGITGRVERQGFEFLSPTDGSPIEETRTPWSVGGFVGFSHLPWRNAFSIEFRHQTRFKAARTAAVCPGTTGVTICPVGPVGPPTEREHNVLTGEYRQRLGDRFAFSIRGSYDFEGNIFQLDVPLYFIADASLGLSAGVRARYVDDPDPDDLNEGLVFGIFVSKSFSLFQ